MCPHGIFVFFLVTGCISLSSHICMHVCICLFALALACARAYEYVCMCTRIYVMCVCGGGGGGSRGEGAHVCIHACYYGCSHLLIYFVFLYVSIDVCECFLHVKRQEHFFGFVRFINIHYYYYYYYYAFKDSSMGITIFGEIFANATVSWRCKATTLKSLMQEFWPFSTHHPPTFSQHPEFVVAQRQYGPETL